LKHLKKLALLESVINVLSGLLISIFIVQPILWSIYEVELSFGENFTIATVFTLVSIARGWVWRVWFHKKFYERFGGKL